MGKTPLSFYVRDFIAGIAFTVLLWAYGMNKAEYRRAMYEDVKAELSKNASDR